MEEDLDIDWELDADDIFDFSEEEIAHVKVDISDLEKLQDINIVFCKCYQFQKWKDWFRELSSAANDFKQEYRKYPNVLLTSRNSYFRLCTFLYEFQNQIIGKKEFTEDGYDILKIGIIELNDFAMEICVDASVRGMDFLLIFDSEPDWEESGIPVEESYLNRTIFDVA